MRIDSVKNTTKIQRPSSPPEFTAVVLACSVGTRLFPLTSPQYPKHLLPVAGVPILHRLLFALSLTGFKHCVIAIQQDDSVTIPSIEAYKASLLTPTETNDPATSPGNEEGPELLPDQVETTKSFTLNGCVVHIVRLHDDCPGSGEALRQLDSMKLGDKQRLLDPRTNAVVFPGDLIVLDPKPIKDLIHEHRESNSSISSNPSSACTVLLTNVSEVDENGVRLKESAKSKKGGLSRDEEEIEYIALSYPSQGGPRLVWKQPKVDVEEDVHMTGDTAKLSLPKIRLMEGRVQVCLDWNDIHVYVLSPWIRHLVRARESTILSLKDDLLPLLVSRQYKGVLATFGSAYKDEDAELKQKLVSCFEPPGGNHTLLSSRADGVSIDAEQSARESKTALPIEYMVKATVQPSKVLRSHTVPAYLYANRELLAQASTGDRANGLLRLPPESDIKTKFQTIMLPGASIGDKATIKSTVVGKGCKIGNKCRLNNVVLVENVVIGDNTTLQNTVVASNASVAENCSLNDCQLGPNKQVPAGTKAKNESFLVDDF